jgi:Ca2+/Na+ antiporter
MATKKSSKTFDATYSVMLLLSSFVIPIVVYRNLDFWSAAVAWVILVFMLFDFRIRSTQQERQRRKRYKERMEDKRFLEATKEYRSSRR